MVIFPITLYVTKSGIVREKTGNSKRLLHKLELAKAFLPEEEQNVLYTLLRIQNTFGTSEVLETSDDIIVACWRDWRTHRHPRYQVLDRISYEIYHKDPNVVLAHYKIVARNILNPMYNASLQKRKATLAQYKECAEQSDLLIKVSKDSITLNKSYILQRVREECEKYQIKLGSHIDINFGRKQLKNE